MSIVRRNPLTPSQRFLALNRDGSVSRENNPVKSLTFNQHRDKGRSHGQITSRRRGGGHKRRYRLIDFARTKYDIPATVQSLEYDPNRSANIALIAYQDGAKSYILAPGGLSVGDTVVSFSQKGEFKPGNSFPLREIPPSCRIHAVELTIGGGAVLARSAGTSIQLVSFDDTRAILKLPSGELRYVDARCRATLGEVGNASHQNQKLGKAGRNRWLGRRPRVRGVAMNPVDHPMGGGEGRTSGGGHPCSPWGQLAKGYRTRRRSNPTNKQILVRRNGKKLRS